MLVRSMMIAVFVIATGLSQTAVAQEGPGDPSIASEEDGKYFDADGDPTFKYAEDGTVDWYTYSGYRRYHSECHVCHGPDGLGSSYAPAIAESMKRLTYADFLGVVASGKQDVDQAQQKVMPAFGTNLNVMCYIDDIYIYLRARAQGDIPRGRPPKHEPKPDSFAEAENACLGT